MRNAFGRSLKKLLLISLAVMAIEGFMQTALLAQTQAGTVIGNQAQAIYTDALGHSYAARSMVVSITVLPVRAHMFAPDDTESRGSAPQHEQITRLFTLTNTGNTPDSYRINEASATAPAEVVGLYWDDDHSGTLTPGDGPIPIAKGSVNTAEAISRLLPPGKNIGVLAVVKTNDAALRQLLTISLVASSATNPDRVDRAAIINQISRNATLTAPDNADGPPLKLVNGKERVTASAGETLNYTIAFRNRGEVAARQVLVTDDLPASLDFVSGTLRLNNRPLTDAADADQGGVDKRRIQVRLFELAPNELVNISFQARLVTSQQNTSILNAANITGENFGAINSSTAVAIADPFGTVYAGRSAGSVAVAGAVITLSTDANIVIALPESRGFSPNESNQNPYTTASDGHFSFNPSLDQIGANNSAATYRLNVSAPNYRSRLIEVTTQSAGNPGNGRQGATLRALDNQPLAQAGSFALTNQPVSLTDIAAIAFNLPLFEESTLAIEKSADRPAAEIGDTISYRVIVSNPTQTSIRGLIVRDRLPEGLVYAQGSAQMLETSGAWPQVDPETDGDTLVFRLPELKSNSRFTLSYRVRVGANAREGLLINTATAAGIFPDGEKASTPPAQAPVRISTGIFATRQVVMGRVFADVNGNGLFDTADHPIAKARVYTDKGLFVVTDSEGMYNLPVVEDGALVIALDPASLPAGYTIADGGRRDNQGYARLLRTPLQGGALLKQDFALESNSVQPPDPGRAFDRAKDPTEIGTLNAARPAPSVSPSRSIAGRSEPVIKPGTYEIKSDEKVTSLAPGSIEIISPKLGELVMSPGLDFEARVASGWRIALEVNDIPISANSIGTRKQFHAVKVDSFTYIGISLRPGPNRIKATAIGPDERSGDSSSLTVMGRGPLKRLEISAERKELRADGQDSTPLVVRAFDEWGNPAADTQISIATTLGRLIGVENAAPPALSNQTVTESILAPQVTRQTVISLNNGAGSIQIVSDNATGEAQLTASSGKVEARSSVQFIPELRPTLLVGLAEASIGRAAPEMSLRNDNSKFRGHIEFFFRGPLFGKNLLTLAYDSQRPLNRTTGRDRLFQLDPLDRAYPVFGDSSTRFESASSNSKVYARLDRGRSYAMFGDFETDLNELSLTGYARNLTGAKVHLENAEGDFVSVTGARPDTSFARDVFAGDQLGLVTLSHADVLQGSETVTLEVRDRRNPEVILSRERLVRSVDYNLDPVNGQIFFMRSLTAFDLALNLRQIVITYEHYTTGNASNVYTGRAAKRFRRYGLRFGVSLVNQRQEDLGSFVIAGFDGEKETFRGGKLRFEYGMSRGRVASGGNLLSSTPALDENARHDGSAYRVELEQPLAYRQATLRASYAYSGAGFFNPFGATISPGARRAAISLEMKPRQSSQLRFGFSDERNETANVDNSRETISAEWTEQISEGLRARLGYDHRRFNDNRSANDVSSNLFTASVDWQATDKLQLSATREQNLGGADPTYPNQTTLAAKYQLSNLTRLFFTQRLASDAIRPISDVQATGFALTDSRRETSIGVETKLTRFSALSGRYQIDSGINGTDSFAVIGLQNRLPLNKQSAIEIGYERGFHLKGENKSFNTLLLGYSWQNEKFRSAARYELRDRAGLGNIFTAGAAGKLGRDVTVLGRWQLARGSTVDQHNRSMQGTAAAAYRPLHTDRVAFLFSYNRRSTEQTNARLAQRTTDRIDTLSSDGLWQASSRLEVYGRFALKSGENGRPDLTSVATLTFLTQARAQYKFGKYLDAAIEGRFLDQGASATRRTGAGTEIGFWALPELRFAVGYNFTQTSQRLAGTNPGAERRGFYFNVSTKLSRMFDLFGASRLNEADKPEPDKTEQRAK